MAKPLLCFTIPFMSKSFTFCFLFILPGLTMYAQHGSRLPRHLQIGPKGMDTTAFSEIMVFRDSAPDYNNYWFSVMIDGTDKPAAIINAGYCNLIRTRKQGAHTLYSKTYAVDSVELLLQHGKRYYVEMRVIEDNDQPQPSLRLLTDEEGERRWIELNGETMVRYMHLADRNSEFAADKYPDSLRWRAGKALFSFLRPPSLEVIKSHIAMVFHEPDISPTYSEFMTLTESKEKGIKDATSFLRFAEGEGQDALKGNFRVIDFATVEMRHRDFPQTVIYYIESEDSIARNKGAEAHLHIRNVAAYFYLPDYNRKGGYYTLIVSERGLPSELSTKEELLGKFSVIWSSLQLIQE